MNPLNSFPAEVRTASYAVRLTEELGKGGGQGRIFRTTSPQVIVKLLKDASPERRGVLERQLQRLRWLGGEDDLARVHLTRPGGVLQAPHLGYTLELLTGMIPLEELLLAPDDPEQCGAWYLNGGGLGRRLRLLARAAEVFHALHARSLVYADPSTNNIFISETTDADEVWLIDVDNLQFESGPGPTVYTKYFAAPEVYAGRSGVNTLTDAHAFAVIAFETLTLTHPLLGDTVQASPVEMEEAALRGEWGYIDSAGGRNACSVGLPREWVLWPPLRDLARKCFEDGLNDPLRRPGMSAWVKELHAAADTVLPCPECGWGYNVHHRGCPACGRPRPELFLARVFRCRGAGEGGPGESATGSPAHQLVVAAGAPAVLTDRVIDLRVAPDAHDPRLVLMLREQTVHVKVLDGGDYWLVSPDGKQQRRIDRGQAVPREADGKDWLIHLGPPDRAHQAVRLAYYRGAQA